MTNLDIAQLTAPATLAVAAFGMVAASGTAADTFGMEGRELTLLGRGGTMGDVNADAIAAAVTWMAPEYVRSTVDAGLSKAPMAVAAAHYAKTVVGWGEVGFADDLPCARSAELLRRCVRAASPAVAPIFSGWRRYAEPSSPKSLLMHQLYALREYRQAVHAGAVLAAGLRPLEALLIRTPALAVGWGWPDPQPEISHLVDRWKMAEDGTNRAMSTFFEPLSPSEGRELVEGLQAVLAHTGEMWWYDDVTIRFGKRPEPEAVS